MDDVMHAAVSGFKSTLCLRSRGGTTVYRQQVTCKRCLRRLRQPLEKTPVHALLDIATAQPWQEPDVQPVKMDTKHARRTDGKPGGVCGRSMVRLTGKADQVTCKNCLKRLAKEAGPPAQEAAAP